MLEPNRPQAWKGKGLTGNWLLTLKIEGIRAIWHDDQGWLSRAHTPLYNIPAWQPGSARDCELFVGSFRDTIRATRTKSLKDDTPSIENENLYGLEPLDPRLSWGNLTNPTAEDILAQLQRANELGYEGLVLRQGTRWIKV